AGEREFDGLFAGLSIYLNSNFAFDDELHRVAVLHRRFHPRADNAQIDFRAQAVGPRLLRRSVLSTAMDRKSERSEADDPFHDVVSFRSHCAAPICRHTGTSGGLLIGSARLASKPWS